LPGGILIGLLVAGVASVPPAAAQGGGERMSIGGAGKAVEFQTQVGDRVFFSESSAELGARGRLALEAQAAWLLRHPHLLVTIEGHADETGVARHNLEVSQHRAETVRRRLIELGIARERIRTVAYGRQRLVADCAAAACAAQNRRAVTVVDAPPETAAADPPGVALRGTPPRRAPRHLN
jgi:peptidoglycan-associated lipoprotein